MDETLMGGTGFERPISEPRYNLVPLADLNSRAVIRATWEAKGLVSRIGWHGNAKWHKRPRGAPNRRPRGGLNPAGSGRLSTRPECVSRRARPGRVSRGRFLFREEGQQFQEQFEELLEPAIDEPVEDRPFALHLGERGLGVLAAESAFDGPCNQSPSYQVSDRMHIRSSPAHGRGRVIVRCRQRTRRRASRIG